ncbi:pro-neuregulin-4, membrane-bound isoform [Octopus vulgaris]|uniref:Pro-neuregulin-4, membrane-bound isoform n=1 Tax=Octopus vulgaris TaxID=6645 RepID=A0AA36ARZ8_OCTVU|nr:pro-neuregulin-4, membrane-bound isoform [Octopus vulgaris]
MDTYTNTRPAISKETFVSGHLLSVLTSKADHVAGKDRPLRIITGITNRDLSVTGTPETHTPLKKSDMQMTQNSTKGRDTNVLQVKLHSSKNISKNFSADTDTVNRDKESNRKAISDRGDYDIHEKLSNATVEKNISSPMDLVRIKQSGRKHLIDILQKNSSTNKFVNNNNDTVLLPSKQQQHPNNIKNNNADNSNNNNNNNNKNNSKHNTISGARTQGKLLDRKHIMNPTKNTANTLDAVTAASSSIPVANDKLTSPATSSPSFSSSSSAPSTFLSSSELATNRDPTSSVTDPDGNLQDNHTQTQQQQQQQQQQTQQSEKQRRPPSPLTPPSQHQKTQISGGQLEAQSSVNDNLNGRDSSNNGFDRKNEDSTDGMAKIRHKRSFLDYYYEQWEKLQENTDFIDESVAIVPSNYDSDLSSDDLTKTVEQTNTPDSFQGNQAAYGSGADMSLSNLVPCSSKEKFFCLNGGTCYIMVMMERKTCNCPAGYIGERCEMIDHEY